MESINSSDKKKLYSLFESVNKNEETSTTGLQKNQLSDILIIDGLNTFIKSFCVSPYMNADGIHTGGISGFLKSIGYAIKLFNPTKCVIVFDGSGGSQKRRKIYPDYKNKRVTKIRINRTYLDNADADTEEKNLKKQLIRTVDYLKNLPVTVLCVDNVEADDVIAYLSLDKFKDSNITIMSSDKDFLQLASNRVKIWSSTKKKLYGCAEILSEYGISCENFINYRVLEGDVSDNIDGIYGAGLKTIKKCFPIFEHNYRYSLDEIFNYCESHKGKYKLHDTILDNKSVAQRNYDLMQLNDTQIQSFTQLRINEIIDSQISRLNRMQFIGLMREDKIWNNIPNGNVWLSEVFTKLDNFIK